MQLTPDQELVVSTRNKDILVSAAAGSGKTAVLVQRILSRITDEKEPVDIDRMLIVTFTNAAAAEMRLRIHREISDRLEREPDNENLQRQASFIHNAQITTIDSFCMFLLRNHFHEIGLEPAFRVADAGEIKLIEQETLAEMIEEFFDGIGQERGCSSEEEELLRFWDAYAPDGKDGQIEDLVMRLYRLSMSHPWPVKWLDACEAEMEDLSPETIRKTVWMQSLWDTANAVLSDCVAVAQALIEICRSAGGPYMYESLAEREAEVFSGGKRLLEGTPDEASYTAFKRWLEDVSFERLPSKKDDAVLPEKRELGKRLRTVCKDIFTELRSEYFADDYETVLQKEKTADEKNRVLIRMTKRYIELLGQKKKQKNLIDFYDAEHMALAVLSDGEKPTPTALDYRAHYEEIMIDEYQDSNLVQEILLSSIARREEGRHNRFMVGDMKQSIYRFRLARPELFMDKYDSYQGGNANARLICLKQNFRSRSEVLQSTNRLFETIMIKALGGIAYDDDAMLHAGASFPEGQQGDVYRSELLLLKKDGMNSAVCRRMEARLIARKIRSMVGSLQVADKAREGGTRPASYRDIVILTRSERGVANVISEELLAAGIPVHVTSREGYFAATEISVLMDFLRVLDNPYDDIAMCSVLTSVFFGFDEEMLSILKLLGKAPTLYECLRRCVCGKNAEKLPLDDGAVEKVVRSCGQVCAAIEAYRDMAVHCDMTQLVSSILKDYGYVEYISAMPAGRQRRANVEMFVEKTVDFEKTDMHGLFSFIRYMEQLKKYEVDFGEAATLSETADVVRIMTIHKSKGLEFPICFVACTDKKFNTEDLKKLVLMDADWGLGSDYIDLGRRVSGRTLKKKLLLRKNRCESLGEELRVLYVAMTRAKEKLILTGCADENEVSAMEYAAVFGAGKEALLCYLQKAQSMLDYLMMGQAAAPDAVKVTYVSAQDIMEDDVRDAHGALVRMKELQKAWQSGEDALSETQREAVDNLKQKFAFRYPHENLNGLRVKTSVSELKRAAMDEAQLHPAFETDDRSAPILPAFMKEEKKLGGTDRGTAYHRLLELLDFGKYADLAPAAYEEQIIYDLERFVSEGKVLPEYAALISPDKISAFLKSNISGRMMRAAKAGKLHREQPFVLSLPADRLNGQFPKEELVLIQGIIDVYFEEEDGYVILDYKTDRVFDAQELVKRYRTQLDYYGQSVSRLTEKPVNELILYSFALEEEISCGVEGGKAGET